MASEGRQHLTEDAVLGGRLKLLQPARGHRAGHDAILLAAATVARKGDHVVDLGAGVGAAGLALATRVPGVRVTLVEIDAVLADLATHNIGASGLGDLCHALVLDVGAPARAYAAADLGPNVADGVMMNPPFNDPGRTQSSPHGGRRLAHMSSGKTLAVWVKTALRLLKPKGNLTLIWRADGLSEALEILGRGFGGVRIQPVFPKPGAAAIRVIVSAVKGSRAPLSVMAGLVLNDAGGQPSPAAEAILREGAALPVAGN